MLLSVILWLLRLNYSAHSRPGRTRAGCQSIEDLLVISRVVHALEITPCQLTWFLQGHLHHDCLQI